MRISAYTYQADLLCPSCVLDAMTTDGTKRPGYAAAALGRDPEQALDALAAVAMLDRYDEHSFDSDEFPKVVFADQVEPGDRCGACGSPFL